MIYIIPSRLTYQNSSKSFSWLLVREPTSSTKLSSNINSSPSPMVWGALTHAMGFCNGSIAIGKMFSIRILDPCQQHRWFHSICQSIAEVWLTGVVPLGALSHRFNLIYWFHSGICWIQAFGHLLCYLEDKKKAWESQRADHTPPLNWLDGPSPLSIKVANGGEIFGKNMGSMPCQHREEFE